MKNSIIRIGTVADVFDKLECVNIACANHFQPFLEANSSSGLLPNQLWEVLKITIEKPEYAQIIFQKMRSDWLLWRPLLIVSWP